VGRYWIPRYLFKSLVLRPLWPIVQTPDNRWGWFLEQIGGMKFGRGNRSTLRKPTPVPLRPPQNPTWQTRSRTPDHSGGKPATNRLSYGVAFFSPFRHLLQLAGSRWRYSTPPPHRFKCSINLFTNLNSHIKSQYTWQYSLFSRMCKDMQRNGA
jgi:hypothetical protein